MYIIIRIHTYNVHAYAHHTHTNTQTFSAWPGRMCTVERVLTQTHIDIHTQYLNGSRQQAAATSAAAAPCNGNRFDLGRICAVSELAKTVMRLLLAYLIHACKSVALR